jgi:hypothetical protein
MNTRRGDPAQWRRSFHGRRPSLINCRPHARHPPRSTGKRVARAEVGGWLRSDGLYVRPGSSQFRISGGGNSILVLGCLLLEAGAGTPLQLRSAFQNKKVLSNSSIVVPIGESWRSFGGRILGGQLGPLYTGRNAGTGFAWRSQADSHSEMTERGGIRKTVAGEVFNLAPQSTVDAARTPKLWHS